MAASGTFKGPLVLLGISLSERDEPAFFRAIVRLGTVLGGLPSAMLMRMTAIAPSRFKRKGTWCAIG